MLVNKYGQPLTTSISAAPVSAYTRQTIDEDRLGVNVFGGFISPQEGIDWKLAGFTEDRLVNMSASELLDSLADSSPDLSRALYDMHQNIVTSWTWTTEENDLAGNRILEDAADQMAREIKEPIPIKLGQLVDSGFLRDAFYTECIFNNQFFVDIKILDPFNARFQFRDTPERGQHWQLGQERNGQFEALDSEFIQYMPLIPRVTKPYGRSVVGSAIYPMVFLLGMIKSARQVIETQAWPNRLVTISREELAKAGLNPDEIEDLVKRLEKEVPETLKKGGKGAQFVFGREIAIEIVGAMNRVNMDAIEMMEKILERWIIRALKQYPVLFAITDGNALSTNAEQQLEQFASSIDSLLRKIEEIFSTHGTQILRNNGNRSTAIFQLKRNNSLVERYRAERMQLKTQSIKEWITLGMISPQEGRTLIRTPDSFENLNELLEENLPPDAISMADRMLQRDDDNDDEDEDDNTNEEGNN